MAASYNHTQTTASTIWTINHGLSSSAVVVGVYINVLGNLESILPYTTRHVDNNTLEVTFTSAQSGAVRIVV